MVASAHDAPRCPAGRRTVDHVLGAAQAHERHLLPLRLAGGRQEDASGSRPAVSRAPGAHAAGSRPGAQSASEARMAAVQRERRVAHGRPGRVCGDADGDVTPAGAAPSRERVCARPTESGRRSCGPWQHTRVGVDSRCAGPASAPPAGGSPLPEGRPARSALGCRLNAGAEHVAGRGWCGRGGARAPPAWTALSRAAPASRRQEGGSAHTLRCCCSGGEQFCCRREASRCVGGAGPYRLTRQLGPATTPSASPPNRQCGCPLVAEAARPAVVGAASGGWLCGGDVRALQPLSLPRRVTTQRRA